MAEQFTLHPTKFSSLRRHRSSTGTSWTDNWKQAQGEEHMVQGHADGGLNQFRSLLAFAMPNMANVESIVSIRMFVYTAADHVGMVTQSKGLAGSEQNLKMGYKALQWAEQGGGERVWTGDLKDDGANINDKWRAYARISPTALARTEIDVGPIFRAWLPAGVKTPWGNGLAKPNYGMVLMAAGDADLMKQHETVLASPKHSNTSLRPYVVITYNPKGGPGLAVGENPNGTVPAGLGPTLLTGHWEPGRPGDTMTLITIKATPTSPAGAAFEWTHTPDSNEAATSSFSVPVDARVKSGITYAWSAKVKTAKGDETPYSGALTLRLASPPPSLTGVGPTGTHETLDSVRFTATYEATMGEYRASAWVVQMRTQLVSTDPTWADALLWDTGLMTVPLSAADQTPVPATVTQFLETLYGGPALNPATTYSYRIRAQDQFGSTTPWTYGTFTMGLAYVPSTDDVRINMTRYGKPPPHRIRIYAVDLTAGAKRKPGKLLAELTDAANIGASEYYNSAGEFYFTLPAIHPQAAVIEPYQCHYELQLHTGQGWKGIAFGIITDFDATDDEVVFYGQDYLGILARTIEERFSTSNAELDTEHGGAKYSKKTIKQIVVDQLYQEAIKPNSPLGFINILAADIAEMPEESTIYASFKQRLPFIAGLIDSSRAGTGRNTRLVAERNSAGVWKWRVLYAPGLPRPNIRLQYGGMVQGFRTIPFANWGTAVNATGRTITGTKVYSARKVAPGISEATYGAWPTTTMYQDIDDENDLQRRANQAAAKVAKVGKNMGLGLRVSSLTVKDGWDITDSVIVDIKRGVVDTSRYHPDPKGDSYWTIWGWTWSSYPDGHTNMVLSLAPREDIYPPNPDLIPSAPILDIPEWQLDSVPPTTDDDGTFWMDTTTGDVYEKQEDGSWLLISTMMGPPGPEGPPGEDGITGATGPPGADGATLYTWVKYADTALGAGISDSPTGKAYVGFAYNKTTPVESNNPADYAWSTNSGTTGPPGPPGANGESLYTWVKYANDVVGTGMSDDPTGKTYIGLAYNKAVSAEGTNPADYSWSLIQGPAGPTGPTGSTGATGPTGPAGTTGAVGPAGPDGATLYTWTKYADNATGTVGMSDSPAGKAYIGLAFNKTTAVESSTPGDYAWSLVLGPQGVPGSAGSTGPTGPTLYTWIKYATSSAGAGISDDSTGKTHIGFAYNKTTPTESVVPTDYEWSLIQGPTGPTGPTGGTGPQGPAGPTGPAGSDAAVDTTPPTATNLRIVNARSELGQQDDGSNVVVLRADLGYASPPAGLIDLSYYILQYTRFGAAGVADWTKAVQITVTAIDATGTAQTPVTVPGAVPGAHYWLRVYAVDKAGNRQNTPSPEVTVDALADNEGPPQPQGIVLQPGHTSFGVRWDAIPVNDLDYVEVRYRVSPAGGWSNVQVNGTLIVVTGVANDVLLDVQLRSVDTSGNTSDAAGVDYKVADHPNDGWTTTQTVTPTAIAGNTLVWDAAMIEDIFAQNLDADWITAGTLKLTPAADGADAIEVWTNPTPPLIPRMVGRWAPVGGIELRNADSVPPKPYRMRLDESSLIIYDDTIPAAPVPLVTITPAGIDAASVTFGSARGGHNLIQNSSFELGAFGLIVVTPNLWDVAADWNATRNGADTNITTGASALTMTTVV